jgi:hypothetical protein
MSLNSCLDAVVLLAIAGHLLAAQVLPARAAPMLDRQGAETGGGARVYDGRSGQTSVRIPRLATEAAIDGSLDGPAWRSAAMLTGFSQYSPVDGRPADDSTQVLVWYSPTALYVGIRAFEAHGPVHATLASRDNIDADDNVQIILSTYHDGRQAFVFGVNPFGVQEDGTMTEGRPPDPNAPFTIISTGRPPLDLTPDFVYESKGHLTGAGYGVTVRIPFRSLRYQSKDVQDWGINILRKVQHSGYEDTWTPASRSTGSFLAQSGTLAGMTDLHSGLVLDLTPIVTEHVNGSPPAVGGWQYAVNRPQFGLNLRYGVTQNLTLNGTVRPDFAEVESDVVQFVTDPRVALFFPEKRPFFLDGIERFAMPLNRLIYTRQIVDPLAAVKLTGKVGNLSMAYLAAQDNRSAGVTGTTSPIDNLLRLQTDVGAQSKIGLVATDVEEGGSYNRVLGADAFVPFGNVYTLTMQGMSSESRKGALGAAGPAVSAQLVRNGHTYQTIVHFDGKDPEFQTRSGYIPQSGIFNAGTTNSITLYGARGNLLETVKVLNYFGRDWLYRDVTSARGALDYNRGFDTYYGLRGGWNLDLSVYLDVVGYDRRIYRDYYVARTAGADTMFVPFTGGRRINTTNYRWVLGTPQLAHLSASVDYTWGRGPDFLEWSAADLSVLSATGSWRPTTKLRVDLRYDMLRYNRHTDGTLVSSHHVPRLNLEYQLSRPVFVRLVGQYDAAFQDNLRDDSRTNLPIYLNSTGAFQRATGSTTNGISAQWLFAYQPLPGTVFFAGYGDTLTEPVSFHFDPVHRTADAFLVKFSYLFRA